MKGSANKFEFLNLPKLSRARLALDRVFDSTTSFDIVSINAVINDAFRDLELISTEKLALELHSYALESRDRALAHFGKDSLCVGGIFHEQRIPFAILINERTVIDLVYLLMGSKADFSSSKTFLTPVEEGIFSFILSRVFQSLQIHSNESLGIDAHLDPLSRSQTAPEIFLDESHVIHFFFDLKIDDITSRFSILVAARALLATLHSTPTQALPDIQTLGLQRAGNFHSTVSLVAGTLALAPDQLQSLQVGDIVILDTSELSLSDNSLSGELGCHFGEPLFATANAQIHTAENGKLSIQISNLERATPKDTEST